MYSIELTIGSVTKTVNPMSLTLPEQVCSDTLTHVELSVPVTLEYEAELLNFLISADTVNAIVKEGEEVKFTGVITTNLSFKDIGQPLPVESISLTIKDNTYKLKNKLDTELVLLNETLSEIISSIAVGCDLQTVIPEAFSSITLPIFIIEKGQQYLNALNQLCFSYGYSFYFNADGALCFFNFDSIPEAVDELNGYHICTNEVSRQTKQYTGVKIGYNKIITKLNELVYYEGFGFDSQNKPAPAIIQPGVYFPFESSPIVEVTEGQVYQSFESGFAEAIRKFNGELEYRRSKKTTLIYTQNHTLVEDWEGDLTINRTEYESKRASVRFINNSTLDVSLYQLAIRADAWYRTDECEVLAGDTGTPYEYDAQYVYDAVTAENLAKCLFKYFTLSQFTFKTKHDLKTAFTGTYKNIRLSTGAVCKSLCIAQAYDPTTDITYATWLTVSSPSVIQITASKNTSGTGTEQGAADNAQNTADTALDQINDIVEGTGENAYPDTVTGVLAVAEENGIKLTANPLGNGTKNNIKKVQWLIKRHFDADWTAAKLVETPSLDGFYYFNRAIDGYPEADQLDLWEIKAQVVNTSNKVSPSWSTIVTVTTDLYGTWSVGQPVLSGVTLKRALTVQCTQPVSSRKRYGDIKYRIEIKRHDDATYFKPNLTANPYEDEQNYKDGEGYVVVANTFTQTVPMEGQSTGEIEPTLYSFQVTPYNTTTGVVGTPAQLNLTATASSALDMYPHSIGPSILAIYDLLAVCGKFGSIQDEAIEVNSTQFWNMARLNSLLGYGLKGELCLGTTAKLTPYDPVTNPTGYKDIDSFIHWLPESIDGLDQGVYMKLKSLLITAIKARITGNFEVVQRQTERTLFKVDDTTEFSHSIQTETSIAQIADDDPIADSIIDKLTVKTAVIGTTAYHLVQDELIMLVQDLTTGIETEVATPVLFKGIHNISGVLHGISNSGIYIYDGSYFSKISYFFTHLLSQNYTTVFSAYTGKSVALNISNILYVVSGNDLVIINLDTLNVLSSFYLGSTGNRSCIDTDEVKLYLPHQTGTLIDIVDVATLTVVRKELPSNSYRQCCKLIENELFIPLSMNTGMEIFNTDTYNVEVVTLSETNKNRIDCTADEENIYIPTSSPSTLEIVNRRTRDVQTLTFLVSYNLLSIESRGSYIYILTSSSNLIIVNKETKKFEILDIMLRTGHRFVSKIIKNLIVTTNYNTNYLEFIDLDTLEVQETPIFSYSADRRTINEYNGKLYFTANTSGEAVRNIEVVNGINLLPSHNIKASTHSSSHIIASSAGLIETIKVSDGEYVGLPAPNVASSPLAITIGSLSFFPDFTTGKITVHNAGLLSVVNTTARSNIKTLITDGTNMYISGLGNTIYKVLQNGTQEALTLSELSAEIYYTIGIIGTHLIVIPETSDDKFAVVDLPTFTLNTYAQFSPSWGALRGEGFIYNSQFWLSEKNTRIQHCLSGAIEELTSAKKLKKIGSGFVERTIDEDGTTTLKTFDGEKLTFDTEKNLVVPSESYPLANDAILYYSFDEITDIIVDHSYSLAHAENHGVIPVDGVCGKAGYFNNSYMIAPRPSLADDITIYFWVKFDALGAQTILQSRTIIGEGLSVFQVNNTYRFDWRGNQGEFVIGYTLPINTWHHVTMKCNATKKVLKINGKTKATLTGTYGLTENLADDIWSGMSGTGGIPSGNILTGSLDGLRIIPRFTTDDEDTAEYKTAAEDIELPIEEYSTTEERIGTWIDGRPLYRKVVNVGALKWTGTTSAAHGITNLDIVVKVDAMTWNTAKTEFKPLPIQWLSTTEGVQASVSKTHVSITTYGGFNTFTSSIAILTYVKT